MLGRDSLVRKRNSIIKKHEKGDRKESLTGDRILGPTQERTGHGKSPRKKRYVFPSRCHKRTCSGKGNELVIIIFSFSSSKEISSCIARKLLAPAKEKGLGARREKGH